MFWHDYDRTMSRDRRAKPTNPSRPQGLLRALLVLPFVTTSVQLTPAVPTEDDLNPNRPHIEIILSDLGDMGKAPEIALYATSSLTGSPIVKLTGDGLFVRGNLVCSWPSGHFDGSNTRGHLMVLGYADENATDYHGCPSGLPIKSFWSYHDGRDPNLFIEVASRRGSVIEARQGVTKYYFDLSSLQGDPAVRGEAIDPLLARVIRRKGVTGWAWIESRRDSERRASAALARLRKDITFQTFVREVRACLSSSGTPKCFVRFVKPEFYYPDLWDRPHATPEEFVEFVWRQSNESGLRPWDQLVACFSVGRMTAGSEVHVRFATDAYYCDVIRVGRRWLLENVSRRP